MIYSDLSLEREEETFIPVLMNSNVVLVRLLIMYRLVVAVVKVAVSVMGSKKKYFVVIGMECILTAAMNQTILIHIMKIAI